MLTRNWGWVVLRGVVAILFGLLALFRPGLTLAVLVLWFGAYALVDGAFLAVSAIANRKGETRWGTLLAGGLLGMAAGVITFLMPALTVFALLALVAAWAIVLGVAELVAAVRLRKEITGEWMFIVAGLLAVGFGVVVFAAPITGALAVALWVGVYALVSGVTLVALGFRLRSWGRMHHAV
ncbi:MAG: HdeD family acid-resistance protein [Gemmatimonadota bacterium]|nr:HdeD family acid-resistance protein [Gemmatimonadota bacterium]MDE3173004.1 HdeD family acid-resistance protein [Gemmatimonadota bacterium]MDE3215117.1 HdeD family acid-resistance protein [Gemmatimonadota bacterium]